MRSFIIVILLFICISCATTKYVDVPVPVETVRTEYVNLLYRDSVFIRDSVDRYIQGDTVYQYKYKYIYKYSNRTDTVIKTDSIEIPVEVKTTKIVEVNKIKWYQSILMQIGVLSFIFGAYKLGKFIKTNNTKI